VQGDAFIRTSDTNATTSGLRILNSASSELFVVRNSGIVKVGDGAVDTGITGNLLQINSGLAFWAIRNNNGLEFIHSNATLTPVLTIGIYRGYSTGVVYNNLLLTRTFANGSANNAAYNSINVSDTINQTGGANGITRGLYVNPTLTAAADWRSIEWSNNSGWGLYGAGTANNYLGGNTTIRTNSSSYAAVLQVENTGSAAVDNKNVAFFIGARGNASNIDDNTNISVWQKNITVGNYGVLSFLNALGNLTAFVGAEYTTHTNNPTGNLIFGTTNSSTVAIKAKLFNTGNLLIQNGGTFTDSGYRLDVNGTARVSGAALFGSTSSFGGNMTLAVNQNDATTFQISNANSNASSVVVLNLVSSNGSASIGKRSNTTAVYRFLNVNDAYIYNSGNSGDIGILNDYASGSIKMGAGGSSTAHFTIKSNGRINMSSLPTSATGLSSGDLWNDGGTLKIV
jgi:hypothetical protein